MRKTIKYLCSIGFLLMNIILFSITGNGKENMIRLVVAIPFTNIPEKDVKMIEKEINKITKREIGVIVEFPDISTSADYYYDATSILDTTEQVDIMLGGFGSFMECYVNKKLLPLNELLDQYGQNIKKMVGEDIIHCCDINNTLYGIPVNGNYVQQGNCYVLRKDILDKYNINISDIHTMTDLEKVFEIVKKGEPDMTILDSGSSRSSPNTILSNQYFLNTSLGTLPLIASMDYGKEKNLTDVFESQEYKEALRRVRRWYLKGYVNEDIYSRTKTLADRIKEGEIFAYTTKKMWNSNDDIVKIGGKDMVEISIDKEEIAYNAYASMPYVITCNSISPEKSMQLLDLFYSNADIENLLCYGIEGIHYKKVDQIHITDIDENNRDPFLNNRFNMPNQYISYVWENEAPDFWEKVKEANKNAVSVSESGFNFDYSAVDAEYASVNNIYQNYKWILENGLENPETGLKSMLKEMKEEGMDQILIEVHKQYNIWKREKGDRNESADR